MKYISLDIETVPLKIEHEDVKEYLMDKKISKEQRSLDPNYSKIITIGLKSPGEETKIFYSDDEKQILTDFWNYIQPGQKIITHNGYKFDIPFILIRSCINNIKPTFSINTNRWGMMMSNHFDTMMFFSHYENFINQNLTILAKMNGIEIPEKTITGRDVEKAYKNKEWNKIIAHCKQDVEILEKIFEKLCLKHL